MSDFNRVLICGTGPVSIQMAVYMKKKLNSYVGITGRTSSRSEHFFTAINHSESQIQASVQNELHQDMAGECSVDEIYNSYESVKGQWDVLMLAVTTDAYGQVLHKLDSKVIQQAKSIILISPTLGSNHLVQGYITELNPSAEIISFSTYLGDTRWIEGTPSNRVLITAVKKKLYIGSTVPASRNVGRLCTIFEQSGIDMERVNSPIAAEGRNISLYVHPPLFMNDFSLETIFGESDMPRYVYKLFPEGPITQDLIREMLHYWKEISAVLKAVQVEPVNLLEFMIDDNYPVRKESIHRHEIEHFTQLESIHQQYLLYVRYASLLIDPYSRPDKDGKYFDFSAIPFKKTFINKEGKWDIPRMPKEDYYRIKIIQGIAKHLNIGCPTLDCFVERYESKIRESAIRHHDRDYSDAFTAQSFANDLERICLTI
ncbi:opine metallophore biosynthesis dehydrogenase [Neobacillus mesonae]|nr:opine metallophore biosynthesis dehydrogenase [Neobacillus mesonae]